MAELIVEALTRSGVHIGYHKIDTFPANIGRALDNDIVLADPYLSSYHLAVERGNGGWIVTDLHSANGMLDSKGRRVTGPIELKSGDQVLAGKTALRFLSPTHPVPPALPIQSGHGPGRGAITPAASFLSILVTMGAVSLFQLLNTSIQTKPVSLVATALPYLFFPLLWAGIWSCAGFIVRRRAAFSSQFLVANGGFVLVLAITSLTEYIDFYAGSPRISNTFQYVSMGLLAALALFISLKIAAGVADARRAFVALAIGGGVVGAIALIDHAESVKNRLAPVYSRTLKPPYAKHARSVTLDEFMKDCGKLFVAKDSSSPKR